jgi:hypothetical protein
MRYLPLRRPGKRGTPHAMTTYSTWLGRSALVGVALFTDASCSSGGGGGAGASPLTLVSECDQICSQLATCGATAASLEGQCMGACGDLALVQAGCLDPFAAYLTCLAGATSIQCGAGGQYVVITPQSCDGDRETFLNCSAGPSPVAACVELPGNTSCQTAPVMSAATFCVGAPAGCTSPQPNPLGIGTFCCPSSN